jgi:hypothetical protein
VVILLIIDPITNKKEYNMTTPENSSLKIQFPNTFMETLRDYAKNSDMSMAEFMRTSLRLAIHNIETIRQKKDEEERELAVKRAQDKRAIQLEENKRKLEKANTYRQVYNNSLLNGVIEVKKAYHEYDPKKTAVKLDSLIDEPLFICGVGLNYGNVRTKDNSELLRSVFSGTPWMVEGCDAFLVKVQDVNQHSHNVFIDGNEFRRISEEFQNNYKRENSYIQDITKKNEDFEKIISDADDGIFEDQLRQAQEEYNLDNALTEEEYKRRKETTSNNLEKDEGFPGIGEIRAQKNEDTKTIIKNLFSQLPSKDGI